MPGRPPNSAIGAPTVPIRRHVMAASVVPITSAQAFLPHAAAPSTHPRWADNQVTELASNPAGTLAPGPPDQASAGPGVIVAAQVKATAAITRTARADKLITYLLHTRVAVQAIPPARLGFQCAHLAGRCNELPAASKAKSMPGRFPGLG